MFFVTGDTSTLNAKTQISASPINWLIELLGIPLVLGSLSDHFVNSFDCDLTAALRTLAALLSDP